MRLTRVAILLFVAAFLAVEPVVHSHPLLPGGTGDAGTITNPNICAICAVGADRVVIATPAVAAPVLVVECLFAAPSHIISAEAPVSLASRAPPAA